MTVKERMAMERFPVNAFNKFDCTEEGCDRKGENGFPNAQMLGYHRFRKHGIEGREGRSRRERLKREIERGAVALAAKTQAVKPQRETNVDARAYGPGAAGAQSQLVVVAQISQLVSMAQLSRAQLEEVFQAILATKTQ